MSVNYFGVLGLAETATDSQIDEAYRKKKSEAASDPARLSQIEEAYLTLADPAKRKSYLQQIQLSSSPAPQTGEETLIQPLPPEMRSFSKPGEPTEADKTLVKEIEYPYLQGTFRDQTLIFSLKQGSNLIGRPPMHGDPPDIPLADPYISRRHAILERDVTSCSIIDLGSANGTFFNGQRLKPDQAYPIQDKDVITIEGRNMRVIFY